MIISLWTGLWQTDFVLIAQSFVNDHSVPYPSIEVVTCNYVFRLFSFETFNSGVNIYMSISVFYVDSIPVYIYVHT